MYIELTEEQRKNLFIFLERTELKGGEVLAFSQIINSLHNPIEKINNEGGEE